ncbi:MAG TPA: glutathione-regulated potassium-efflux system protein KefC [Burkholderiaceae bacterium]|nr:glutathione-regulated potassium-efflux system protein KefC [Burkholderiaceae bacterium]
MSAEAVGHAAVGDWLSPALVYLGAAVLAVPLAKRLGFGAVLGYLIGGIVIGPYGLGLITDTAAVLGFAEFGVVLMLFLVGLELAPAKVLRLRRPIFVWGSTQMALCTAAIGGLAWLLGAGWQAALVLGFGLSLSSTAIALQALAERHQAQTETGQTTVALSLAQDIQSIPVLALIPALAAGVVASAGDADQGGGWLAAKALAVVVAIVFGGRYLVRPLFRAIARSDVREVFTAAALLLVIGVAWLMRLVELSMGLGAFLAGVLLANSEYRRALETDIEPFKGLLLGLFFIAVGMSIDFGVLLAQPWQALGLTLGFMAIKFAIMRPLAGPVGIPLAQRNLFALLIAQGSEFAFVLFGAAATARVVAPATAALWIGAVALSMLLTPLLLLLVDRLARRHSGAAARPEPDAFDVQDAPIIVAGIGRYGQIVTRVLLAAGLKPTVLDHNPDQVEALRRFGFKSFYGDATRLDLLHNAGAASARVLVVAVDDRETSLAIVDLARAHFPNLQLVARAHDVAHWNALRDRGVTLIDRELFESSLGSARKVLEAVGHTAYEARELALRFRRHNLQMLELQFPHHADVERQISVARQGREQLEAQLAQEREERAARRRQQQPPDWGH